MRFHLRRLLLGALLCAGAVGPARAFDLVFTIDTPSQYSPNQLSIITTALNQVEGMWETMITGYRPGINIPTVPITLYSMTGGLANAGPGGSTFQGGFWLTTSGFINLNILEIENFANWQGPGANGLNFIDELLAHETGHVLGIGTQWTNNNVYQYNTFRYTGQYGVAAYQAEFGESILYAPVENAGNPGTPNAHWDQLMRSSPQEGNPLDPWSLDPRVGVVDRYGRDRGLELMTGAIDPDYREPFVARFTIQSMRDLGYTVTEFEDFNGDGVIDHNDLAVLRANFGAKGLQIDSMRFGDADRDRDVDGYDLLLWQRAFVAGGGSLEVPEPGGLALAALALSPGLAVRRRSRRV